MLVLENGYICSVGFVTIPEQTGNFKRGENNGANSQEVSFKQALKSVKMISLSFVWSWVSLKDAQLMQLGRECVWCGICVP